jgi:hypothetical protein
MSLPPPFYLKAGRPILSEDGYEYMASSIRDMSGAIAYYKPMMTRDREFTEKPDGLYTWIIKSGVFLTIPVTNAQEVGAVHINMWSWTPDLGIAGTEVTAAGELEKQGPFVLFNLKSGTFMEGPIRKGHLTKDRVDTELLPMVKAKMESLDLIPLFNRCSPCTHDYETISGEDILDTAHIITEKAEIERMRPYFRLDRVGVASVNSEEYAELTKAFGAQLGGARRAR